MFVTKDNLVLLASCIIIQLYYYEIIFVCVYYNYLGFLTY